MSKFISIGEAASLLGVSTQTLRRWEREGRLLPDERTHGNQRRYDATKFKPHLYRQTKPEATRTIG